MERTQMMKNSLLALGLGLAVLGVGLATPAEASNLDTYRNLLEKHTYTIKFKDITPEPRVTNRDVTKFYGKNDMDNSQSAYLLYKQNEGVVVCNGENRYEELKVGAIRQCRLQKGSSSYVFIKQEKPSKDNLPPTEVIIGNAGKNKVVADETNFTAQVMQGEAFGSTGLTRYLNAILPDQYKSKDMPSFRYVDEGWLNNGLNYVDMRAKEGEINEAVRYYFNGYNMVKIAAIKYWRNAKGVFESEKTIIRINEFSATPDAAYLELPAGVKEVKSKTKAKK